MIESTREEDDHAPK